MNAVTQAIGVDRTRHDSGSCHGRRARIAVVAVAAKKAKKRVKAATDVYVEEVASDARPIEAVGTAVAAFAGLG
jgi:hypothetical protein